MTLREWKSSIFSLIHTFFNMQFCNDDFPTTQKVMFSVLSVCPFVHHLAGLRIKCLTDFQETW